MVGAVAVAAVLFGFPVVFKCLKLVSVPESCTAWGVAWALFADAALALVSAAFGLAAANLASRLRAGGVVVHFLLFVWCALLLEITVIEHGSWDATGTLLDWSILKYTLVHMHDLSRVVGTEMSAGRVVLMAGAPMLAALPVIADLAAGRFFPRIQAVGARPAAWTCGVGVVFLGLGFLPGPDGLQPLRPSAPGSIMGGALADLIVGSDDGVEEGLVPEGAAAGAAEDRDWWQERMLERAGAVEWPEDRNEGKPLNVVFFIIESGRWNATTPYNPSIKSTPVLDKLAQNGAVVERAYTDVPHTSKAIVSPLCGYSPRYTFEIHEAQPQGLAMPCLPHYLRNLGYRTAFFQSATGTFENRPQLVDNLGFEDFFAYESLDYLEFDKANWLGVEDDVMLEPSLEWVDAHSDAPFFLTYLTITSHHEYDLPGSWKRKRLAPSGKGDTFDRYLNAIGYEDRFFGKVMKGLEERGVAKDTLVVVFGDHGQGFREHGRVFHNDVIYEEGLRVPLVFSNAGLFPARKTVPGLRRLVDVTPTVLSLIGAEYPDDWFEGMDIFSTRGHARAWSSCWYKDRCQAEIDGWTKVIHHFDRQADEVYDLEKDPEEKHDLMKLPGAAGARARATAAAAVGRMLAWREEIASRYREAWEDLGVRFVLDEEPVPDKVVRARFGNAVELLGYDISPETALPGSNVDLTVYFRCLGGLKPGWKILGHLETADKRVKNFDHHPGMGRLKLEDCVEDTFVADRQRLWVPPNFPEGELTFYWGVFRGKERQKITALSPDTVAVKDRLELLKLEVEGPHSPALEDLLDESVDMEAFPVDNKLDVELDDSIVIVGTTLSPSDKVGRGDTLIVTTVYEVKDKVEGAWRPFMHLHPSKGKLSHQDHSPVQGLLPVASWKPGTFIQDRHSIHVNPRWALGKAELWGGLYQGKERLPVTDPGDAEVDAKGRILLGTIEIAR